MKTIAQDVYRLSEAALRESHEGLRCSKVLLSLWNSQVYPCNLQVLLDLNPENFAAFQRVLSELKASDGHLERYLPREVLFDIIQHHCGSLAPEAQW